MNFKFSQLALVLIVFILSISCKSTGNNAKLKGDGNKKNTVSADSSKPNPLNKLQNLNSNVKTEEVAEGKSGFDAELPFDANVRTGTLSNGMRYYIRKNAKPENRVELRLALNAGSMQEEDSQQGLAHFVEHMCFNGTKNFEKNALVNFLELTGVRFGADLNAYTSFDETVYMLQLPTDKEGLVDKGLTVMQDWAGAVTFANEEIDKERGVILSEWRTRLGADERMRQVYWPKIFYQTRYANRLPIGTTEVITKAPYERLTTFYKDWYRPNLMALVVVGDINVDEIEKKVKERFVALKNPENPKEKITYEVPGHKETFVGVATDPEATRVSLQVIHKHDPIKIKTIDDYRNYMMGNIFSRMIGDRYDEIAQKSDAPFSYAGAGYGSYVRSKDGYFIQAGPKENSIEQCIRAVMTEQLRVKKHGFTESEFERAKIAVLRNYEQAFKEADKQTSGGLSMEYVAHFLEQQPVMGVEKELQLAKELIPTIKLTEVNQLAEKWITKENRSVVLTAPAKEGLKIPTEEYIVQILDEVEKMEVEPYKDKFLDMPLMAEEPKSGSVSASKSIADNGLNVTEMTLSNGIKVILKPTDFQNDQILLSAFSPGGHSIYDDKDFLSAANADEIVTRGGVGEFDKIALDKKLTGKTVRLSPYIGELWEGFDGSSSKEDFETMLQLVHLYATKPRKEKDAFDAFKNEMTEEMRNALSSPQGFFSNEFQKVVSGNHLRRRAILSEKEIESISLDRAYEVYKERFADCSDFTFVLVGNVDPEKSKPLIEKYLGSLPAKNRKENWKDVGVYAPKTAQNVPLVKGLAPQSNVIIAFPKDEEWTRDKALHVDAMVGVLNIMVRENLREDKGGVYSPFVGGGLSRDPHGSSQVIVFFQCAPEDVEKLVQAVKDEVKSLQTKGPSEDNMAKVKETRRRTYETNIKRNNFWVQVLNDSYQHGESPLKVFETEKRIEALKLSDVQNAAKSIIDLDKAVIVTVKPEKTTSDKP
jgi:zinc protease